MARNSYCLNQCNHFPSVRNANCCCSCVPACCTDACQTNQNFLNAVIITPQTVGSGEAIPFQINSVAAGCKIVHTMNHSVFLLSSGCYQIMYHLTVSLPAQTPPPQTISITGCINGLEVAGSRVIESVLTQDCIQTFNMNTIVEVPHGSTAHLSFVNQLSPAVIREGGISILRL